MSNSENKPEIAGAICAPPAEPQTNLMPQPRQPTSLQGLLKFAMEATKSEDAPHESHVQPMDEAKRKFLEQALHSLTIDVIEILLKQIKILEKVDSLDESGDDSEYIEALNTILEYVCDIDTANDFHKIGGFAVVPPCLKCKSPKVRAEVCNLLAELCQNNAYCQRVVLENGIMPMLVDIVEHDEAPVVVKAVYAISCIVRQSTSGCAQLIQYRGVQIFLNALQRNEEKINIKICFLLHALCNSQPDFKSRLIFVGYIPVLFSLISDKPKGSDEHVLALLLKLVEENPTAISECRQNKLNGKEVLENYLSVIKGKEEYSNEEEYCNSIYNILFAQG